MQKTIYMKFLLKRILNCNQLVEKKGAIADALVDGKLTIDTKEILEYLLA